MKEKGIFVKDILPGSIAEEAGIEQGDIIVSINGEKIRDIFDYRFWAANEELLIEVLKKSGDIWEIEVEKDEYEDLGIGFEASLLDDAKSCTNKCIFCFIDQLPAEMRDTLYFKDDDSRLSFLMGNYVTLTNMSDYDLDRIIKYKMSPINISVHATNPELRRFMLGNRFAGNIMEKIKKLVDAGITVNCQIVLCRGINDGEELDRTISELAGLYPGVRSISVVPVGITRHRKGLHDLKPYDAEASKEVILQVGKWQKEFLERFDSRVVYIADEFYIMAGLDIPEYEHYEDFPQIENGVGLVALLKYEFNEYMKELQVSPAAPGKPPRQVSIATGVSSFKYIKEMADILEEAYTYININVFEIKNEFFGENVTVTGLLTGKDIAEQLKGKKLGDQLLISKSMLKAGENIFLDDYSIEMLERQLNVSVCVVENDGKDFIDKVLGNTV